MFLRLPLLLAIAMLPACGDSGGNGLLGHWPEANAALEAEVLERVNAQRAMGATCGSTVFGPTDPLDANALLTEAARGHSLDMVERDYSDHTDPDGDGPGERLDDVGYEWSGWGENIAAGQTTADDVMAFFLASPGHCANIMNPDFEAIGVGYYEDRWTQVFGTPR